MAVWEALPEIIWYAILFFTIAFVWSARKVISGLLTPIIEVIGALPLVGGLSAQFLLSIEQNLDNHLGEIEHRIDALMGASFHAFAALIEWQWREMKRHASLLLLLSNPVAWLLNSYSQLRRLVHHLTATHDGTAARVKRLEKEYHGIDQELRAIDQTLARLHFKGIDAQLKHLRTRINTVEHQTIPAIRAQDSTFAGEIGNLYDWAKGKASLLGVGTFAGAVAVALSALGLGSLRCPSFLRNFGNKKCGLWDDLAALLGLATVVIAAEDFDKLVHEMQSVEDGVITAAKDLFNLG